MKLTYLFFIYFLCIKSVVSHAQIVNEGNIKICSGTTVYFYNEYTNKSTGNHNCDGYLYLNHDFMNDGITASASGTTYLKSATNNLIHISGTTGSVNLYNLEIDMSAPSLKGVLVADDMLLHVKNSINFKNGNLRLIGESQLIQSHLGTDLNTVVSGKLLKDQQGYASAFKYNYWSSPVNNGGHFSLMGGKFDGTDSSLKPFTPQQISFNTGSPHNGQPAVLDGFSAVSVPLSISKTWLYKYTQASGSYAEWKKMDENSMLLPGEGYSMKGSNSVLTEQNYVFYGAPNNGNYTYAITKGEEALLGNPYPSALDVNAFLSNNLGVVDALYFWVDGGSLSHYLSDYLGGYAIRNLTGGIPPSVGSPLISGIGTSGTITAPTQYVSVGQGFFVKAIDSGNINFENSQRVFKTDKAGETLFYRSYSSSKNTNKYIRLGYEDPEGFHRQLLLGFMPNSTANMGYNKGYDAKLTYTRNDDLFFVINNDTHAQFAIQGVDGFSDDMEFPLGLKIFEAGLHKIKIDAIDNFENTIYLKDNISNTFYDLNQSDVVLNLPVGEYLNRFSIVFQKPSVLGINQNALNKIQVYYDGNENIVIKNEDNLEIKSIEIYDMLGRQILKQKYELNADSITKIPFHANDALYIINLKTTHNTKSIKILKY